MKVYLGTDHAGFELKEKIKSYLLQRGFEVEDCGAFEFDKDDDYPDFIARVADKVSEDPENSRGIIFGGSGQAETITANKFKGVRCVLFYAACAPAKEADVTGRTSTDLYEMINLTREHNNANMLSLGSRFITEKEAIKAIALWLESPFTANKRHVRRIEKIKKIENENFK